MSGRLVILRHKSWHVWNQDNQEKVLRDERLHAEAQAQLAARNDEILQEHNLQLLRISTDIENQKLETAGDDGTENFEEQTIPSEIVSTQHTDAAEEKGSNNVVPFRLFGDIEAKLAEIAEADGNPEYAKEKAAQELKRKKNEGVADWALGDGSYESKKARAWYENGSRKVLPFNAAEIMERFQDTRVKIKLECEENCKRISYNSDQNVRSGGGTIGGIQVEPSTSYDSLAAAKHQQLIQQRQQQDYLRGTLVKEEKDLKRKTSADPMARFVSFGIGTASTAVTAAEIVHASSAAGMAGVRDSADADRMGASFSKLSDDVRHRTETMGSSSSRSQKDLVNIELKVKVENEGCIANLSDSAKFERGKDGNEERDDGNFRYQHHKEGRKSFKKDKKSFSSSSDGCRVSGEKREDRLSESSRIGVCFVGWKRDVPSSHDGRFMEKDLSWKREAHELDSIFEDTSHKNNLGVLVQPPSVPQIDKFAELRRKRLEREQKERKRAAVLLATRDIYGAAIGTEVSGQARCDEKGVRAYVGRRQYSQQYHPSLAKPITKHNH